MSDGDILLETRGAVAIVRFNDDATLNALSLPMADRLTDTLRRAGAAHRAIVLTGVGRGFCSGANLSGDRAATDVDDPGIALDRHYNPLMRTIRALPVPFVTAVNGVAAGIGCALALAGDIIVAAETSYFLQAFRRIGLVPDSGSAFLLTRAAGRARAMEMMLLGERVPAATALEWGMINRLVPPAALEETALALAADLAAGPTRALAMIRKMCWDSLETGFAAQLDAECDLQRAASRTADHREGIAAFLGKRPATFTGA